MFEYLIKLSNNKRNSIDNNSLLTKVEKDEEFEMLDRIDFLLTDKQKFILIDANTVLAIIKYLGVPDEKLMETYKELISIKNFEFDEYTVIENKTTER